MQKLKETDLALRVKKYFKINPGGSHHNYAMVMMGADLSCPMQDEDKLCTIQGELGAESLSHTCKTYPRKIIKYGDTKEMYATLS